MSSCLTDCKLALLLDAFRQVTATTTSKGPVTADGSLLTCFLTQKTLFSNINNDTTSRCLFAFVRYLSYSDRILICKNSNIFYLPEQIYINARLAATKKNSPARVRFLPSLSMKSIVNNIPE